MPPCAPSTRSRAPPPRTTFSIASSVRFVSANRPDRCAVDEQPSCARLGQARRPTLPNAGCYRGAMSRMLEEIRQQPAALERTLASEIRRVERFRRAVEKNRPRLIVLVARGTSDNAALFG